jgi:ectoine hydroxylase-related dioxygenase (phytanoyl-CoA dioxygenase family)
MNAGDLLIFNSLLAHGIKANNSEDRVRIAQYVSMYPADEGNEEARERRIRSWMDREHPTGVAFPGDPRGWEKTRYERAVLTELGERLLGLRSWTE